MSSLLNETFRKKIDVVISRYPVKEAALLPVLHLIQQESGFIGPQEEILAAELLDLKPVRVREVVSFYSMFSETPKGKYHIQVCSNLSCRLAGGEGILDYLISKLGLNPGETSEDKKFSLSTVECLGACEIAPCMMINFDYYGPLDKNKLDNILDGLK